MTSYGKSRTPHVRRRPLFVLLAGAVMMAGIVPIFGRSQEAQGAFFRHLALRSSIPAADAEVSEAPGEVRLIFTETPQLEATTIRLADGSSKLVPSTETAADGKDPREIFIRPQAELAPGSYTVHWRAIAQDGHAVNGDFGFEITAE